MVNKLLKNFSSEIVIYKSDDGKTKIETKFDGETVWLNQNQLAELFNTTKQNISLHLKNAFEEGEVNKKSTVKKYLTVQNEGSRQIKRNLEYYNLEAIVAIGYRVKSNRGTQFRIWATSLINEYLKKGFVMNDELLKNLGGGNYWKELLDRIRDIRSSEKVFYRQILDIFATSVDYDPNSDISRNFFKTVQNKIHFGAHGKTAAEIIYARANAKKSFMGLTNFSGRHPIKSETIIAKNYLNEKELELLNLMSSTFFDNAELYAKRHKQMKMSDWVKELDEFCEKFGKGILEGTGSVSHDQAQNKALKEYEIYKKKINNALSDIEKKYIKNLKNTQKKIENSKRFKK
jgi:hypothetical protein